MNGSYRAVIPANSLFCYTIMGVTEWRENPFVVEG